MRTTLSGRLARMRPWLIALVVAGAVASLAYAAPRSTDLVVYFQRTDGIYAGDEVRVLGVPVGTIDQITPEDDGVRVEISIDDDVDIPADAKAAVVAPSLVSSRYIQLAPRYEGGPTLDNGDVIPLERTAVPVEWDTIKDQLNDVVVALGPRGADKNGALSRLVDSSSKALEGQGATLNQTIADLASVMETLDAGGDDAFSTVRNLQVFAAALAESDVTMGRFIENLDSVSDVLAEDGQLIRTALRDLGVTVDKVERFVRTNRAELKRTVTGVGDVTAIVARRQRELAQILHAAPNALENLTESYHERQNGVGVNLVASNIHSPGQLICGAFGGASGADEQEAEALCNRLVGQLLDQVAQNPQSQQLYAALLALMGGSQ